MNQGSLACTLPPPGDVHLWHVRTDVPFNRIATLAQSLSEDERERAGALRFDRDRNRFVVRRAALRQILGAYVGSAPEALRLVRGAHGKPVLTPALGSHPSFNVSHSNGLAVIAVTSGSRAGIDIEQKRRDVDCLAVAACFFAPEEVATLRALPEDERLETFFALWTCKEAWLKACGLGLAFGLDRCRVSVGPDRLLRLRPDPQVAGEHGGWVVTRIDPAWGYAGALVAEGPIGSITVRDFASQTAAG